MHRSRILRAGVLVLAMVVLGSCTSEPAFVAGRPSSAPTPKPDEPTPQELLADVVDRYGKQKLKWGSCGKFASTDRGKEALRANGLRCARMTVPLDYDEPDGQRITIGVLRRKATGKRLGALVTNPGGPGASGVEAAALMVRDLGGKQVGKRFDIVGFDPRGLGSSRPQVRCWTDKERDAERADDSDSDGSAKGVAKTERQWRTFARKCVQRTKYGKKMLANVGTTEVVKDMDVLRAALREPKLTYLGYSYGTRIGYVYAATFGRNIRAMLLDGAVDPNKETFESRIEQAKGFGTSFRKFAQWCARQGSCALGSDPDQATRRFQRLTRPLMKKNLPLRDGRSLSYEDATNATITAMYSDQSWPFLNDALADFAQGSGEYLMDIADHHHQRDDDGSYSTLGDAGLAVRCVDRPPRTDRAENLRAAREVDRLAPFADPGGPNGVPRDMCEFWPVEHTLEPGVVDLDGVPPVLVISTTGDPATPYAAGRKLADAMGGRLLTYVAKQHTAFGGGNKCIDKAGADYLIKRKLPKTGTRCKAS